MARSGELRYAQHEDDPVVFNGDKAIIYINGHWQGMCPDVAAGAVEMTEPSFRVRFGKIASLIPGAIWK